MKPCSIANFSTDVLAASHIRKAHANYEWTPINTGGEKLIDLKGKRNLYIKCAECGCEITTSGGCPDCGNNDFYIEELMERRLVECPELSVHISSAGFLKIDVPDDVKKSNVIRYTFNGSQPRHTSPEWKSPIKVPTGTVKVSVCLFGKGTKSQVVTVNHLEMPQPLRTDASSPEYISCYCGEIVISSGSEAKCTRCGAFYHRIDGQWFQGKKPEIIVCGVCSDIIYTNSSSFTCSKCGAEHQFNPETNNWICLGISHKCELCGASITLSNGRTMCSRCCAEYDISESGSISYKGYAVVKCKCGKSFRATSTSLSECMHCHKKYEFSKGIWNEKKNDDDEGCSSCLSLIILIIIIILKACSE